MTRLKSHQKKLDSTHLTAAGCGPFVLAAGHFYASSESQVSQSLIPVEYLCWVGENLQSLSAESGLSFQGVLTVYFLSPKILPVNIRHDMRMLCTCKGEAPVSAAFTVFS